MGEFIRGFVKGASETPKGYFAPIVAVWNLLLNATESLTRERKK